MSGVVSNRFRVHNAKQFLEAFTEAEPSIFYAFIGRSFPWMDDNSPPVPTDNVNDIHYDIWRNIMSLKRITASDVSFCTRRIDWESGTVYAEYDPNSSSLYSSNFYVMTDEGHVYKCLSNNRGAQSTSKPTGTSTQAFYTADGYKWKYMYTVTAAQAVKFLTNNYIPVQTLENDDGSAQWAVQQAAANGAIESVDVVFVGSGYTTQAGVAQAATNTTITLTANASSVDGFFTGHAVYITSGTGAGQLRQIVNYDGSGRVATVSPAWGTNPDTSSNYLVSPFINIDGDGKDFEAYSIVVDGELTEVRVIQPGENYSWASITVEANGGTGASLVPMLAPQGGHGSDPLTELAGRNVMINVRLQGTESNTFTIQNDFRVSGIIIDPLYQDGSAANALVYSQMTVLGLDNISGSFVFDEQIVGQTSNASAYIVEVTSEDDMRLTYVLGEFSLGETIEGQLSGATATVNSITLGALKPYTGEIVFVENRTPISRSETQIEDLKMVVRF